MNSHNLIFNHCLRELPEEYPYHTAINENIPFFHFREKEIQVTKNVKEVLNKIEESKLCSLDFYGVYRLYFDLFGSILEIIVYSTDKHTLRVIPFLSYKDSIREFDLQKAIMREYSIYSWFEKNGLQ